MIIRFSRHALEKAHRRGAKISHIRQTLKAPDELYEDVEHGVIIAVRKVDDKSVILAYRREAKLVKVITIYYTTKLDKLIKSKTARDAWRKIK